MIAGVAAGRVRFDDFRAVVVPSHGEGGNWLDSTVEMIHIVETVAQSPKGHWYPTRVRRKSSDPAIKDTFMDFYVEFDVEIPDALFDVKNPLPVEELLRKSQ